MKLACGKRGEIVRDRDRQTDIHIERQIVQDTWVDKNGLRDRGRRVACIYGKSTLFNTYFGSEKKSENLKKNNMNFQAESRTFSL